MIYNPKTVSPQVASSYLNDTALSRTAYFSFLLFLFFLFSAIARAPLNVIITDYSNKKIYPLDKYVTRGFGGPGLWYFLPFADAKHSDALVFTNYRDPFYLPKNGHLKVWYGEDLRNFYEGDNIGRVCVDVYVHSLS